MIENLSKIPRVKIGNLPTPVEAMPRLATQLGVRELWIKRDDLTGLAFGGNKVRKLEFFFADALANGAKTILTAGAIQSNHCRQTAAAAAKFGLNCTLILTGEPPSRKSANLLLDELFGAEVVWCDKEKRESKLQEVYQQAWADGKRPYLIPYGGSNATGVLGYTLAVFELINQGFNPDVIVFPSSSGGSQSGLVLGSLMAGVGWDILGISVDAPEATLKEKILKLIHDAISNYQFDVKMDATKIHINDQYLGKGYGIPTEADINAIRTFARAEGILLDPVYTGRAAAGMIDLIRQGVIPPDAKILFWHTGGNPALFADIYEPIII